MGLLKPIQLAVVSNSQFFMEGIKKILESDQDIRVRTYVSNRTDLGNCLKDTRPDFLFIDDGNQGLDIQGLLAGCADFHTKFILFDQCNGDNPTCSNVLYISQQINSDELIKIVRDNAFYNDFRPGKSPDSGYKAHKLTNREAEIVNLIKVGMSNKKIAKMLSIRENTVKAYLTKIFKKLHIRNRYHLLVYTRLQVSRDTRRYATYHGSPDA